MIKVPYYGEIIKYRKESPKPKKIKVEYDLIGRHSILAPILQTKFSIIAEKNNLKVLDIGAYDRVLKQSIEKSGLKCTYHSVDNDVSTIHDYYDIKDVDEKYNSVCMFELIEHLTFENCYNLLLSVYDIIEVGGTIFISTPNPFYPNRFFADVTHIQHWPPADLFAILRTLGFKKDMIEVYALIYTSSLPTSGFFRFMIRNFRDFVWQVLGLDIRGGFLFIATKT